MHCFSNLMFISLQKVDDEKNLKSKNGDVGLELGVGRVIPLKQVK